MTCFQFFSSFFVRLKMVHTDPQQKQRGGCWIDRAASLVRSLHTGSFNYHTSLSCGEYLFGISGAASVKASSSGNLPMHWQGWERKSNSCKSEALRPGKESNRNEYSWCFFLCRHDRRWKASKFTLLEWTFSRAVVLPLVTCLLRWFGYWSSVVAPYLQNTFFSQKISKPWFYGEKKTK